MLINCRSYVLANCFFLSLLFFNTNYTIEFVGLFHRAILMSGSAMSDWAATNHSLQLTMQIGQALNCPLTDNNDQLLTCLRQAP